MSSTERDAFIVKVEVDLRNVVVTVKVFGRPCHTFLFMNGPQADCQKKFQDIFYVMDTLSKLYPIQFTAISKKEIQRILLPRLKMLCCHRLSALHLHPPSLSTTHLPSRLSIGSFLVK
jgi:hypothetical protein